MFSHPHPAFSNQKSSEVLTKLSFVFVFLRNPDREFLLTNITIAARHCRRAIALCHLSCTLSWRGACDGRTVLCLKLERTDLHQRCGGTQELIRGETYFAAAADGKTPSWAVCEERRNCCGCASSRYQTNKIVLERQVDLPLPEQQQDQHKPGPPPGGNLLTSA